MTLGGANIQWDGTPVDSDNLGLGAGVIRSLKTAIQTGLASEHSWPTGGGAGSGAHLPGSAKAFVGTQSAVSAFEDGRLMLTSDTSRLFAVGSGGTSMIGGPRHLSMGSYPGGAPPQRYYWAEEVGTSSITAGGSYQTAITFPNSGFSGVPFTYLQVKVAASGLSLGGSGAITPFLTFENESNVSCTVGARLTGSIFPTSVVTFNWRSVGTRVL